MIIKPNFDFVDGSFETDTGQLVCVSSKKNASVDLCFRESMNITFATIRLHNGTWDSACKVFDDAVTLGKEICKRWNDNPPREGEKDD